MIFSFVFLLGFALAIILIILLIRLRKSQVGVYLILMAFMIAFWMLMEGISYFVNNEGLAIFLQKAKYFSIFNIAPLMLIIAMVFTFGNKKVKSIHKMLLYIVPILSLLSIMTNKIPYAFIQNPSIDYEDGILLYLYNRDIGFYVNTLYSYVLLGLSNIIFAYRYIKSPKLYKAQSFIVAAGSIVTGLFNMFFVTGLIGDGQFDSTPFWILISLYVLYWGIYIMPTSTLLFEAKGLVVENMNDIIIILDNQNNVFDVNGATKVYLKSVFELDGNTKINFSDYVNIPFEEFMNRIPIADEIKKSIMGKKGLDIDIQLNINNSTNYYHYHRQAIMDEDNGLIGELIILTNITDNHNHLQKLMDINKELVISDTIIKDAREAILVLDKNSKIIKVNQSMVEMSGYDYSELEGNSYNMLRSDQHDILFYEKIWDSVSNKGFWEGEIWDVRKNGEVYPKWMSFTLVTNEEGEVLHYVIIASDRTKLKKAETDLVHLAYYDSLTGLPNRTMFRDRLKNATTRARRKNNQLALLFLDLDNFKDINDNLGHKSGDQLLILVAQRINGVINDKDTLCRLGGDEFTLIIEDQQTRSEVGLIAQKIIDVMEEPMLIDDSVVHMTVSIGIAIGPLENESEESLVSKADIAMYQAKESSFSQYCFISEDIEKRIKYQQKLSMDMRTAVKANEFQLYLQPQVMLNNGVVELTGAEALIRWFNKEGKLIPPNEFIHISETNGMIHDIGFWVFEEACRINKILRKQDIHLNLSINVSVMQFERIDFIEKVTEIMSRNNEPINITIEITESLFFKDLNKGIKYLNELKTLGFKIAMDDFGTGFSSMSYLNKLPLDYLKIDKSFIDEVSVTNTKNMAYSILSMATMLEMKTVAEGIETQEQAECMTRAGCNILQGYLYSRPVDLDSFISYVKELEEDL